MTGAALLKGIESAAGLSCCKHRSLQNQPGLQEGPAHRSRWGPQPGHAAGTEGCTGISWYVRCRIRRGEPNKSSRAPPCISGRRAQSPFLPPLRMLTLSTGGR